MERQQQQQRLGERAGEGGVMSASGMRQGRTEEDGAEAWREG